MCRGPVANVKKVTNRHKEASVTRTKRTEGSVVQDEAGGGQRPDFVAFALRLMGITEGFFFFAGGGVGEAA